MARVGFDPATVDDSSAQFELGGYYMYLGNLYRYMLIDTANVSANDVCVYSNANSDGTTATKYHTGGAGGGTNVLAGDYPAGVAVGSITAGQYGFLMVKGNHNVATNAAAAAAGLALKPTTTQDGTGIDFTTTANEEHKVFATVMVVGSSNVALCAIHVRI